MDAEGQKQQMSTGPCLQTHSLHSLSTEQPLLYKTEVIFFRLSLTCWLYFCKGRIFCRSIQAHRKDHLSILKYICPAMPKKKKSVTKKKGN